MSDMPTQAVMPDPFASIMLELALLMTMVIVARWVTSRFRQPSVLGELLIGVVVGNIGYWLGLPFFKFVMIYGAASPVFDQVWQTGVSVTQAASEVFSPEEVGLERQLVVGKHSGSHTIYYKFKEFGIELTQEESAELLTLAREMAVDMKRALFDKELMYIYRDYQRHKAQQS